jgi:hypothetical protein
VTIIELIGDGRADFPVFNHSLARQVLEGRVAGLLIQTEESRKSPTTVFRPSAYQKTQQGDLGSLAEQVIQGTIKHHDTYLFN